MKKKILVFMLMIAVLACCSSAMVACGASATISQDTATIDYGKTVTLRLFDDEGIYLSDGNTWETSDAAVATVSDAGMVTGVSGGKATITGTTADGGKATCEVTVNNVYAVSGTASVNALATAIEALSVSQNGNAYSGEVTWSSSNTSVATIDTSGYVTGVTAGSATITATTADGLATFTVTVNSTAYAVVSGVSTYLAVGEKASTAMTLTQNGVAITSGVTWSSSNTSIATVDTSGYVTGVSVGNATITGTTSAGSASCGVTVAESVEPTALLADEDLYTTIQESEFVLLSLPTGVTGTATWSSSDSSVATVSSSGFVTPLAKGQTTVTATVSGTDYTAVVSVVDDDATKYTWSQDDITGTSPGYGYFYMTQSGQFDTRNMVDGTVNFTAPSEMNTSANAPQLRFVPFEGDMESGCTAYYGVYTITYTLKNDTAAAMNVRVVDGTDTDGTWSRQEYTVIPVGKTRTLEYSWDFVSGTSNAAVILDSFGAGDITVYDIFMHADSGDKIYAEDQATITDDTTYEPGMYYMYNGGFNSQTLADRKFTLTATSAGPTATGSASQLRFVPAYADGSEYVGKYVVECTVTNNTDSAMGVQLNRNGETTTWNTLAVGATATYSYFCVSYTSGSTENFNVKMYNYGVGDIEITDLSYTVLEFIR